MGIGDPVCGMEWNMDDLSFGVVFVGAIDRYGCDSLHDGPEFFSLLVFLVAKSASRIYDNPLDFAVGLIE